MDDMVFVWNPPVQNHCQGMTSTTAKPLLDVQPNKTRLYQVVRATPLTTTIDIDGVHNIVTIGQVTLSQAAQKNESGHE